jgi:hypothetical protein
VHFELQHGVVDRVTDGDRAEHDDCDSFRELVEALHGTCPGRIVARSKVGFPALSPDVRPIIHRHKPSDSEKRFADLSLRISSGILF